MTSPPWHPTHPIPQAQPVPLSTIVRTIFGFFDLIFPAQERNKEVRIAQPAAHFRKVLDIIGLSKDVEIFESAESAMAGW